MGPSPDALWEVEGICTGLRTVKIPLKVSIENIVLLEQKVASW